MNYLQMLERSFSEAQLNECPPSTRFAFLADSFFDLTTYDDDVSDEFGRKAVEVCAAITNQQTFSYISDPANYRWFLLMVNMPFFADKLNWGGSIRGAWWDHGANQFKVQNCGLWDGENQFLDPSFSRDEWLLLMAAIEQFCASV